VAGYDFQKYNGMDDVFLIAPTSEHVHAPFAQVKFDSGLVSLSAGVRHNAPSDGQSKTVWNVTGRAGGDEGLYARGQVGTSFRLPDAYELYVIDPCCETGNPNLVGEESFNIEGGLGFQRRNFSAELIGFHRKVENLIGITYDLPAYPDGFLINTPDAVKVWGGEAIVNAEFNDVIGVTVDYTHTKAQRVGVDEQLVNIPKDLLKVILRAQSTNGRFGGAVSVNYVGNIYSNVASVGRLEHGNYAVVDVSVYAHLDREQRHRIGLRLENALDADYDTRLTRVREDVTNASYAAGFRGTPMTLHATYSVSL
jgi:vitamin B12 transporter